MDLQTIIISLIALLIIILAILVVVFTSKQKGSTSSVSHAKVSSNLRALVAAQRAEVNDRGQRVGAGSGPTSGKKSLALAAADEAESDESQRNANDKESLEKRLLYANWPITPFQFRAIQIVATILLFLVVRPNFGYAIQALVLLITPLMVGAVLEYCVKRRFNHFDEDYPVLLLSFVGLLKTGMSTIVGLESAAKGLEEGSLVKSEVELLIERLRVGMTEDQAINAFGEDIPHPELELFVQSLILSRRVGGQLSETLERLAKQVRKRQQFRQQAIGAVGMERSSLWAIAGIMSLLLGYLVVASPELILPAFSNPVGKNIFEGGIFCVVVGMYWSRVVTDIKV